MGAECILLKKATSHIRLHLLAVVFLQLALRGAMAAAPMAVPAVIVFGDSIVDPGNNNVISTIVKCNFPPYGQDFPGNEPTGRFCNGKIASDFIASGLGVKELVPAYLGTDLAPDDLLTGVSFASSGSGFDPLTPVLVSVLSMPDQLKLFQEYKEKLQAIAGGEGAASIVSQSLYIVCAGADDLANTYFTTPFRKPHYDIPSYVNLMVSNAIDFLKQLLEMGAQRIGFVNLPPIGCLPSQRTLGGGITRNCEESRNQAATMFNSKIKEEIEMLVPTNPKGTKIVVIDIYPVLLDLILRPSIYGFEESTKGCCGTGELEVSILCNSKTSAICEDDTKYVFWDSYHPTERAYKIIVDKALDQFSNELQWGV